MKLSRFSRIIAFLFALVMTCACVFPSLKQAIPEGKSIENNVVPTLQQNNYQTELSSTPADQLIQALDGITSLKIHLDLFSIKNGQSENPALEYDVQVQSIKDVSKPIIYIHSKDVQSVSDIYLDTERLNVRFYDSHGNSGKWVSIPIYSNYTRTMFRFMGEDVYKDIFQSMDNYQTVSDNDIFSLTGLRLSSENLENYWNYMGVVQIDNHKCDYFRLDSTDASIWTRVFASSSRPLVFQSRTTEIWVDTTSNLPYLVSFILNPSSEGTGWKFKFYPYDYNDQLNLPSDLP